VSCCCISIQFVQGPLGSSTGTIEAIKSPHQLEQKERIRHASKPIHEVNRSDIPADPCSGGHVATVDERWALKIPTRVYLLVRASSEGVQIYWLRNAIGL